MMRGSVMGIYILRGARKWPGKDCLGELLDFAVRPLYLV